MAGIIRPTSEVNVFLHMLNRLCIIVLGANPVLFFYFKVWLSAGYSFSHLSRYILHTEQFVGILFT